MKIAGLSVFPDGRRNGGYERVLRNHVRKVVCYALGPKGNNIEQAAHLWLERLNIKHKSEVILRPTPELCLESARSITEARVVAVFWTCAVYYNENRFFFENPDVFPFFFQQEMLLDEMQLAGLPANARVVSGSGAVPWGWKIASHPSPKPLLNGLQFEYVKADSNAAAAEACAKGCAHLCITTESARKNHGLVRLHSFGSPMMVFFGGVTRHGRDQLEAIG